MSLYSTLLNAILFGEGSGIPEKCDVCGRKWNKKASRAMRKWYHDAVVCEHRGKCKSHEPGKRCQYYYAEGKCALRLVV